MNELSLDSTLDIYKGVHMPRIGLGTYKTTPDSLAEDATRMALRHGYRHIDTASLYENEEGIGRAIAESGLARDDIFITTKVWNDEQGYDGTITALRRSLERLGTDHVDLYLVHWPLREHMEGTWSAMQDLLGDGLTRSIGVCNHLREHLSVLLEYADVPPAIDQVEFHPWLQQPQLQAYLAEHDVALEAWAPVMRGKASEAPELVEIGKKYGKSASQVSVRWILELGYVAIPKSVHEERIAANADVFDFSLSEEDHEIIARIDVAKHLGRDPNTYVW